MTRSPAARLLRGLPLLCAALLAGASAGHGGVFTTPPGCGQALNVKKVAGDYASIQAAVNAVPASLSTTTCVVIRDAETYAEQVTVRDIATNGYRLQIMADPSFVSSAPVVSPPAASTAAFHVLNASVTIQNLRVVASNAIPYGVLASSDHVILSSVNINSGGAIYAAGAAISEFDRGHQSENQSLRAADLGYGWGLAGMPAASPAQERLQVGSRSDDLAVHQHRVLVPRGLKAHPDVSLKVLAHGRALSITERRIALQSPRGAAAGVSS